MLCETWGGCPCSVSGKVCLIRIILNLFRHMAEADLDGIGKYLVRSLLETAINLPGVGDGRVNLISPWLVYHLKHQRILSNASASP